MQALRIDRSTVRYTSPRPDDAPLREAMKAVAAERRRFGYRRIHVMLDRQGIVMNQKKLRRLYREVEAAECAGAEATDAGARHATDRCSCPIRPDLEPGLRR